MLKTLFRLRAERTALVDKMRGMLDATGDNLTGAQEAQYKTLVASLKQIDAKLAEEEAENAREQANADGAGRRGIGQLAPLGTDRERTWLEQYTARGQRLAAAAPAYRQWGAWAATGNAAYLEGLDGLASLENHGGPRAAGVGVIYVVGGSTEVDEAGGAAVPTVVQEGIDMKIRDQTPALQICKVWDNEVDGHPRFLVSAARAGMSGWAGESDPRPPTERPKLEGVDPVYGELFANIPATQWLLDDWANAANWLEDNIVDEFAVQIGAGFVSGNGVTRPRGFTTYATSILGDKTRAALTLQYVKTGAAAAFIAATTSASPADCLIDLVAALKAGYRQGAVWLMNSLTLAVIRKFKDASTGQFIVSRNLELGAPENLLGYPVVVAEDMDDIGANKFPVAFGNFKRGYVIVPRQLRMLRDPFSNKPHVMFYATRRIAGSVLNFDAIKLLKCEA